VVRIGGNSKDEEMKKYTLMEVSKRLKITFERGDGKRFAKLKQ